MLEREVAEAAGELRTLEKNALPKKQVSTAYGVVFGAFVGARLLSLSPFRKSVYGKNSPWGHGGEVVEKYIYGQKSYDVIEAVREEGEKTGVMPVAVRSEEKAKAHKTWYMTLFETLFGGKQRKEQKEK